MSRTDIDNTRTSNDAAVELPVYSRRYRNYVLGVLFVGYVFNILDKNVFYVSLESIRLEFELNDAQMGFLGGMAFAFFYGTLGIPIARLADRWNRRNVLSISIVVWSLMTVLVGSTVGFFTLLAARIGVGVGEAGGSPPSHALISDYFPFEKRATALSIYALGIPVGTFLGNFLGGWGNTIFGWRTTFLMFGVPGVLFAALVYLTVNEPVRGAMDVTTPRAGSANAPPILEVFSFLWKRKGFRHMLMGASLHAFAWFGANVYNNAYFQRTHGMSAGEAGTWLGLFAIIGMIGTFGGGYFADKLRAKTGDERWYMWLPAIATLFILPFALIAYLGPNMTWIAPAFSMSVILGTSYLGPSFAVTQAIATLRMRAVATSLLLFTQTLVGLGLGPLLVGVISDYLEPRFGHKSLAYALAIIALINIWAAVHYLWGARTIREDFETTAKLNAAAS